MLQTIQNRLVYVVEFNAMPKMPITWNTEEEKPYAIAFTSAIRSGIITAPGKYGIHLETKKDKDTYNIFKIIE